MPILQQRTEPYAKLHHVGLETTFRGIEHPSSTSELPIHQYLGIKYASIPARFRQSVLCSSHPPLTDATQHGPVCPQPKNSKSAEEVLFGISHDDIPKQNLKHDEFECLNLNITCPGGLTPHSRLPVMLWIHGGGDKGCGSSWVYDGGAIVRKSVSDNKPIILVTINFRLGLLGFAASPLIRDDNILSGEEGTGNYGLRDQRKAMEWLHLYIADFGGDPNNITLFGASTGAADILCHLLSSANESHPLFHRAIVQSAILEPTLPDVASAGWQLSRVMSALQVSTIEEFRAVDVDKLVGLGHTMRTVDDGVFFRKGWESFFSQPEQLPKVQSSKTKLLHPSRSPSSRRSRSRSVLRSLRSPSHVSRASITPNGTLQPLIVGDCSCDSLLWSLPISLWTSTGVTRRLKAICQSLNKANNILRAYDISPYTPDEEIVDRVLELVNDARVAWPTDCFAESAKRERGGRGVYRYVFDQEGPPRGIPHHAADLIYLFDNVPLPESCLSPPTDADVYCDGPFDVSDDEDDDVPIKHDSVTFHDDDEWGTTVVDEWSYTRVRDAMQERWISFAYGEMPWREEKVFVFGPEGETGERSREIFKGRRRKQMWKEALEPLGAQLVQKLGVELSRGPPLSADKVRF